jgi:hypothetical protein
MKFLNKKDLKKEFCPIYNIIKGRGFNLKTTQIFISEVELKSQSKNQPTPEPEFFILRDDNTLFRMIQISDYYIMEIVEDKSLIKMTNKK